MGKVLLVGRLAARDLRYRRAEAVLLLVVIAAATTALAMGLALRGVTNRPYAHTQAATRGPDVVAQLGANPLTNPTSPQAPGQLNPSPQVLEQVKAVAGSPGVTGHSGPYLVAGAVLRARGLGARAEVVGRGQAPAAVDQPELTAGSWVRPGGVVLERTFADALRVTVGDRVTLNGRRFVVSGIAVTADSAPYPNLCYGAAAFCIAASPANAGPLPGPGLAWVTQQDARGLAASDPGPASYVLYLRLRHPARAGQFASSYDRAHAQPGAPYLIPWQDIAASAGLLVQDEQQILIPGSWVLALLAVASVAVLVGGRMAEQTTRVGLLKAIGGTPGLTAAVLLAENVAVALAAAVVGLAAGWLAAPLITNPGAGLVGAPGAPSLTVSTVGLVIAVALAVALASTLAPAIRAAHTSTVRALAAAARPPRRGAGLIAVSRRLPVPLLLGLRLVARRPRRATLSAASIAATAAGIVAVLTYHSTTDLNLAGHSGALGNPVVSRDEQMLLVLTVGLLALAALNAVCTAWATVLDSRHASALARALGATPRQVGAAVSAAQVIPALPGALAGIPLGLGLFALANSGGAQAMVIPAGWWLGAAVLGTLAAVAGLTAIPARLGARRSPAQILQAEAG
jgi:putative ABC transport system permease protein